MDAILIESALFKLGFAFVAVALLFATERALDRTLGVNFDEILAELREAKGTAMAIYFGLRILAAAILIGLAVG